MKTINLIWLIPLTLVLGYLLGYVSGVFNQELQPEIADKLEEMSNNILPEMLIQLRAEMNETQYCKTLQELECELRQDDDYVKADINKEYAPKVLI